MAIASTAMASMAAQSITNKDLLDGLANPSRWLTHSGDYFGHRFSPLTQMTAAIYAPPTSYAIDGRQYVVIPLGADLTAFALLIRVGSR